MAERLTYDYYDYLVATAYAERHGTHYHDELTHKRPGFDTAAAILRKADAEWVASVERRIQQILQECRDARTAQ